MRITKKQVIEAIVNEPVLRSELFFHSPEATDDGQCAVCAVGAVLRSVIPGKGNWKVCDQLVESTGGPGFIDAAIELNNFFAILSSFFEASAYAKLCVSDHSFGGPMSHLLDDVERRELCLHVTEAFFPECGYIEVDL